MTNENAPATGTGEVSADESYEAYEQKFYANASGSDEAAPSDVSEPAEDSDDKTAPESETEDDSEQQNTDENEDGEKKPAKRGGYQRRIDKLTARIKELEAKTLAEKSAGSSENTETAAPADVAAIPAKPKLEDFESIEEFAEALTDWKLDAKDRERTESAKADAAQAEAKSLIEGWNARVLDAKKAHPDYDDVMQEAADIPISPAHQRLFIKSEKGARIAYNLASDHEALEKFAAMEPLEAARYFGQLEASLGITARTKTSATRAPKPPSTVGNRGAVSLDPMDERMARDYTAWEQARNAQLRNRAA